MAIRHDVRLAIEHGFTGTLGVSEVAITLPEYLDFLRVIKDEAGGRLVLVHHASFSTLEQNIAAVKAAEAAGAELVLLSYPPNFYPETEQEIYDYTESLCCPRFPAAVSDQRDRVRVRAFLSQRPPGDGYLS